MAVAGGAFMGVIGMIGVIVVAVGVAGVLAAQQQRADGEVDGQADARDRGHQPAGRRLGVGEAPHRLDHDQDRDRAQQRAVGQRGEDLVAREAVGLAVRRGALGGNRGGQRDAQRDDVHRHVRGVGEQGQGAGADAAGDLERGHARGGDQRQPQPPGRAARGGAHGARSALSASTASMAPKVANVRDSAFPITSGSYDPCCGCAGSSSGMTGGTPRA